MKKITLLYTAMFCTLLTFAQFSCFNYFEENQSMNCEFSLNLTIPQGSLWQIGKPQKQLFNSSSTIPNALVTDTLNFIPNSDTSKFYFHFNLLHEYVWASTNILAVEWNQKIDFKKGVEGGAVEFSVDTGDTWHNAFNSPYVYNYYGFDTANIDTLEDGNIVFSGKDSTWSNVWLCFDVSWMNEVSDSVIIRFTSISDSVNDNKEGWMIDNFGVHPTLVHTVAEQELEGYLNVFPNPTSGRVDIVTEKINDFHVIEQIRLINQEGKVVEQWGTSPTKFWIDISNHPNGIYFIEIITNLKRETVKVILEK
jgi:hypothetical protein